MKKFLLFGATGAGKSLFGSRLLGRKAFFSKMSSTGVTREPQSEDGLVDGLSSRIIDMPGLGDPTLSNKEW